MKKYTNIASIMVLLIMTTACAIPRVTIPDSDEHSAPDIFELRLNNQLIPDYRSTDSHYILRDVPPGKQHLLVAKVQDNESGVSEVTISVQVRCSDSVYTDPHYYNRVEISTASDISTAGPGDSVYIYRLGALNFRLQDVISECGDMPLNREYWFVKIFVLAKNYFNRESHKEYHVDLYPVR